MTKQKDTPPPCPNCDAEHFSCAGFVFTGEERLQALVGLLKSQPQYLAGLNRDWWTN